MTEPQDHHTVAREDLLFTVKMALLKARRLWPKRRGPGDHLALCGVRCVAQGPAPLHGTLAPRPSPRHAGAC